MDEVILETERLLLRRVREEDFESLQEGLDDIEIARHVSSIPHPYTLEMVAEYYGDQLKALESDEPEDLPFIIELRSEKKPIGCLALHKIDRSAETAETGSWVNRNYQRRGIITEAKIAVNDYAFNELGLAKLTSIVFIDNGASNAVQGKMGYVFKGQLDDKCTCLSTGEEKDANLYELSKEVWELARPEVVRKFRTKYLS